MFYGLCFWSGENGSGKSFDMTNYGYKKWLNGETIASNYPLNFLKYYKGKKKPAPIIYYDKFEEVDYLRNAVILFDEAQNRVNAMNWRFLNPRIIHKLSEHRHYKLDVFIASPDILNIDIKIRRLIMWVIHCEKRFRISPNPKVPALFQYSVKKILKPYRTEGNEIGFKQQYTKNLFITKFSKELYDSYSNIALERFDVILKIDDEKLWLEVKDKLIQTNQ